MKNEKEVKDLSEETKSKAADPCGECMGAAFGDCENCPKGRIE